METPLSDRVPDTHLPIMEFARLAELGVVPHGKRFADRLLLEQRTGPGGCGGDPMRPEEVWAPKSDKHDPQREALFDTLEAQLPPEARVRGRPGDWDGMRTTWDVPVSDSPLFGMRGGSYLTIRIRAEFELLCCNLHEAMRAAGVLRRHSNEQFRFVQQHWGACMRLVNSRRAMQITQQLERMEPEVQAFALNIHRATAMLVSY